MGKVDVDLSMSLDAFIAGPNDDPDVGLGDGGERLHSWGMSSDRTDVDSRLLEDSLNALGAIICGRRTYDNSVKWWGPRQGPHGDTPVFVVSHGVHEEGLGGGSPFTFVNDGIESALNLAQEAAGDKDVRVMGGANVAQQYLKAGLVGDLHPPRARAVRQRHPAVRKSRRQAYPA